MPITTSLKVERYNWVNRGHGHRRESYGYCIDQGSYQLLVRRWHWRGFTIWKRTIDSEVVPMWALIDRACLGHTDWVSKFSEHI